MQTNFLSQVKFKQTFNFRPDSDKIIFKLDSHKLYFNFPFTGIKKEKKNKKKQHFSSDQIQTNFISTFHLPVLKKKKKTNKNNTLVQIRFRQTLFQARF
jgi:hypothetical protein